MACSSGLSLAVAIMIADAAAALAVATPANGSYSKTTDVPR
jgi:hypothetical protein